MKKHDFQVLLSQLRDPERCWDAMLDIKFINGPIIYDFLLENLQDSHAVVRWVLAEKCADIAFFEAIPILFNLLKDKEQQVRKTAFKSLKSMATKALPFALEAFLKNDETLYAACRELVILNGCAAFEVIKNNFEKIEEKDAARFMSLVWDLSPFNAEPLFIDALQYRNLFKVSLAYLHKIKSIEAIPVLLSLYPEINYQALIDTYFSKLPQDQFFDVLSETLIDPKLGPIAQDIVSQHGKIVLPYIQSKIQASNFDAKVQWVTVLQALKERSAFQNTSH